MAQSNSRPPQRGSANIKQEALLTLGFFALSFILIFILNRLLHLGQIASVTLAVIGSGCVIFALFRSMMKERWQAENKDAEETVVPILERYAQTSSPKTLVEDYEAWTQGAHEVDLHLQFLQLIVETLLADGHTTEAKKMLTQMGRVSKQAGADKNFAAYKADVEARLEQLK